MKPRAHVAAALPRHKVARWIRAALDTDGPTLVEVIVSRDAAGPFATGWWDFPSPAYYEKEQDAYAEMRAKEQML